MQKDGLHPELERRIELLESAENQGADYDARAWVVLVVLGIILPLIALWFGRA